MPNTNSAKSARKPRNVIVAKNLPSNVAAKSLTASQTGIVKPVSSPAANTAPAANKPEIVNAATPSTVAVKAVKAAMQAADTTTPATTENKPATFTGAVNRAATKPQNYGADHASSRDDAYLRFYGSFLRGRANDSVITYAEIAERQRPANGRNPLPGAGGKSGALDRGILSRFDKFGHTVNVLDPSDKTRRVGFRFTAKAIDLAAVKLGMRDTYTDGKPTKLAD